MAKALFNRSKPHLGPSIDPPIVTDVEFIMTQVADALTVVTVEITGTIVADYKIIIGATSSVGPGITRPKKSLFKLIASQDPESPGVPQDFKTEYNTRFGVPTIGDKVYIKLAVISRTTGVRYELGTFQTLVT